jgi:hypothetical protein
MCEGYADYGGDEAAAHVYRRAIRPVLPPPASEPFIDIGYGRSEPVRLLQLDGFDADNTDISPEQAAHARAAGVAQICQGDFRAILPDHPVHYAAITATDLLKYLKDGNERPITLTEEANRMVGRDRTASSGRHGRY